MKKRILLTLLFAIGFIVTKAQTVPSGLPQFFQGKYYRFGGYTLVDSAMLFRFKDTIIRPLYPSIVVRPQDSIPYYWNGRRWNRIAKFTDAVTSETDPTVPAIAKALIAADTARWNTASRGTPISMLFNETTKVLTIALAGGGVISDTINITSGTLASPTNLGTSPTTTNVSITSSTGTSAVIAAATSLAAGVLSASDKVKYDAKLDSVRIQSDSVVAKFRNGVIIDYDTIRISGASSIALRNAQVGDTLMKITSATQFVIKSLLAGSNVTFSRTDTTLTINATGVGGGETTKGFSLGSGSAVFKQKSTDTLQFRSLLNVYGLTLTTNANDISMRVDTSLISPRANVPVVATSIADLQTKPGNASQLGVTLGYYSPNDLGGSLWRWNSASVATADNMFIVSAGGTGRWERIVEDNAVHIRSLGVYADNRSTELAAIRTAFRAAAAKQYTILLDNATVNLNADSVRLPQYLVLANRSPYTSTPNLRNGEGIYARKGIELRGLNIADFTSSVVKWDNLQTENRPNANFSIIIKDNKFENNNRAIYHVAAPSVDTISSAPRLVNSVISDNIFLKTASGNINVQFPYHNLLIENNIFDSTKDATLIRETVVVGLDDATNMDKQSGLIFSGNVIKNMIANNAQTKYAALLSGRGVQVIGNSFLNAVGPLYVRGDETIISNNTMIQDSVWQGYAIINKNGTGTKHSKINQNIIVGKYGTGIYVNKIDYSIEITKNYIDLYDDANTGDAGIRLLGEAGQYQTINISDNDIYQRSTSTSERLISVTSLGTIRNLYINNNRLWTTGGGVRARLAASTGPTVYYTEFNDNKVLKMNENFAFVGTNLSMKRNQINYPRGTWNGSAWVAGTAFAYINFAGRSEIEENEFINDTTNTASTAKTSQAFRVLAGTSANSAAFTAGGTYVFRNNNYDLSYLTTALYFDDSTYVQMDGDQMVGTVASSPIVNFRIGSRFIDFRGRNLYFPTTATFLTTGLDTAGQKVNVDIRNSTISSTTLLEFTGASQASLAKQSLTLENNDLAATPQYGTGWTTRRIQFKRDLNKKTTSSTAYTLINSDIKGGQVNVVQTTAATAVTVTVPPNSSVPFQLGDEVDIQQYAAGAVTVAPGAGVTLQSSNGLATSAQYQIIRLRQVATDTWTATLVGTSGSGGGLTTVSRNNTLIGDGGSTPLGVDTTNVIGSKSWSRSYVNDSVATYFSSGSFAGAGTSVSPYTTIADVRSLETATADGRIPVFSSTSGKIIKDTLLTGRPKLASGVLSVSPIALASEVSGILPFDNGGNGYTVLSSNTTSTTGVDLGMISLNTSESALVDIYVVQGNVETSTSQRTRVRRMFMKMERNTSGTYTMTLQSTPTFDLANASYAPSFTASVVAGSGVKFTVASSSTETTTHTIYYKVWKAYLNN